MMDTLEKFHIFRETKLNNQINDKLTVKLNIIFETIVRHDHHRGLPDMYTKDRQQPAPVSQESSSNSQQHTVRQDNIYQAIHLYHQDRRKNKQINTTIQ
jgi:hypothetical protein